MRASSALAQRCRERELIRSGGGRLQGVQGHMVPEGQHHFHDIQLLFLVHVNGRCGVTHIVIYGFIGYSISPSVGIGRGRCELKVMWGVRLQQEAILIMRIGGVVIVNGACIAKGFKDGVGHEEVVLQAAGVLVVCVGEGS
eukprot:5126348-Ditylum_brightwellii.AAC.1